MVLKQTYTEENVYHDLTILGTESGKLAAHLWNLLKENQMEDLP